MRNQRGITLIALVITIIVLLILAGVSIAMLTGDNGILTKAQTAKNETLEGEVKERINIALNDIKTEIYAQQAEKNSWKPLTSDTTFTDTAITDLLTANGFDKAETDLKDATYEYTLKAGILELTYYNTSSVIASKDKPIKGTINLKASPYTLTQAEEVK